MLLLDGTYFKTTELYYANVCFVSFVISKKSQIHLECIMEAAGAADNP